LISSLPSGRPHQKTSQTAQSASTNVLTTVESDLMNHSPSLNVPLPYLWMLLTASQCTIKNKCRNWQTMFTENDKSDRVNV
jgi:hypothetical protein